MQDEWSETWVAGWRRPLGESLSTIEFMLSREARRRLTVVLVGARNPQNIGAAARAMQDFGFSDLRVVNEFAPPFEAAQLEAAQQQVAPAPHLQGHGVTSAIGAQTVMASARLYGTLVEAIADCTMVAGTTAIGGRGLTQPVRPLRDVAPELLACLNQTSARLTEATPAPGSPESEAELPRVALLFGSEKTGLTNEQLSFCSHLLTIPMFAPEGRHLSMNLGQSVAVCLYELTRAGFEGERPLPVLHDSPASTADRERLLGLLQETMQRSDYARRFPANARTEIVRQLVTQLGSTRDQAATWMGLLRLILRAIPSSE